MEKAVVIYTDGTKAVMNFEIGDSYGLLSDLVGGLIELVGLPDADMWVNEEGKMDGLPQNPIATSLFVNEYGNRDYVVGNVVITGGCDENGETLGLTDEQVEQFMSYDKQIYAFVR